MTNMCDLSDHVQREGDSSLQFLSKNLFPTVFATFTSVILSPSKRLCISQTVIRQCHSEGVTRVGDKYDVTRLPEISFGWNVKISLLIILTIHDKIFSILSVLVC